jgi:uncharacterized SAM-binding protein YcdF (DUF218 family)
VKIGRRPLWLLLLLCLPFLAAGFAAWDIYRYQSSTTVEQADAAVVLGAAVWGSQPSPVFRERINHAVNLYHNGQVRMIIFTGGMGERDDAAEAEVARQYALAQGVPTEAILTETESQITEQNLANAAVVAAELHLTRFFIVSDPLHMKRAVLMARDLGMDAYPSPTPTSRYRSLRTQLPFLVRETFFYLGYMLARPF